MTASSGALFPFIAFWIILSAGQWLFYQFSRNAALKRRLHPWLISLEGAVFLLFFILMLGNRSGMLPVLAALFIIGSSIFNIRTITFCDSCGRTVFPRTPGAKAGHCPGCGAAMQETVKGHERTGRPRQGNQP